VRQRHLLPNPVLRRVKSLGALKSREALSIAYFRDERSMHWIAETSTRWGTIEAFVFCSSHGALSRRLSVRDARH
jgi:hypothetical protein